MQRVKLDRFRDSLNKPKYPGCLPKASKPLKFNLRRVKTSRVVSMTYSPHGRPEACEKAAKAALELRQNGWTVVDNVLTANECTQYLDGCWTWLEGLGTGEFAHGIQQAMCCRGSNWNWVNLLYRQGLSIPMRLPKNK